MKHFGDITKINGRDVPIVDIVTGGSPCQDLSIAGTRAGLSGERSGLFMEMIRIIKEMRESDRERTGNTDELLRPRMLLFENVVGLFSSNDGEDFRIVLEEIARVVDSNASIPRLADGQSWSNAGCILGDRWSIAWRVHDAQFWGVAQRRRRVSIVGDFGGASAPEILFERKGVSRSAEQSGEAWQGSSRTSETSADTTSFTLKIRGGVDRDKDGRTAGKGALIQKELSGTLGAYQDQTLFEKIPTYGQDAYDKYHATDKAPTLKDSGGNFGGGVRTVSDTINALCSRDYKGVGTQYINDNKVVITYESRQEE